MSFLLRWLGLGKSTPRVGLRPHCTVAVALAIDTAYDQVIGAMTTVLGANVYLADRTERRIEAGFGLVNNERIRCTFESEGSAQTLVRIEALFAAGATVPQSSYAVDALAEFLTAATAR